MIGSKDRPMIEGTTQQVRHLMDSIVGAEVLAVYPERTPDGARVLVLVYRPTEAGLQSAFRAMPEAVGEVPEGAVPFIGLGIDGPALVSGFRFADEPLPGLLGGTPTVPGPGGWQ